MKTQKNTTEKLTWYQLSPEQVMRGLLMVAHNRKLMDKHGLSYILRMLNYHKYIYSDILWKRAELLEALQHELNNDEQKNKLAKLTTSEWMQFQIVQQLNK